MYLDKLFAWDIAVVLVYAAARNLHELQVWVLSAQATLIYESRTESWGSPRFFPRR